MLPPVVDMKKALQPGGPRVHDDWPDNKFCETRFDYGDFDGAIKGAKHVITREYRMNRQAPLPLEGRATLATQDHRTGEAVIYVSHQLPTPLQIGIAAFMGISQRRVRVICPDVGGGDRKSTRLNSSHIQKSRMPSSA